MDPNTKIQPSNGAIQSQTVPVDSSEIGHIMQEMYKKNLELNERNKTLALLRRIDDIVLSTVTDPNQIAQQVSDLLVEEEFRFVNIQLIEHAKQVIIPIAISSGSKSAAIKEFGRDRFLTSAIPLSETNNILVRAVKNKKVQLSHSLYDFLNTNLSSDEASSMQKKVGVASIIIYPLMVRQEVMGVLIMGVVEDEKTLSPYKKALIDRLAGVVGIALDNSLLYQSIQIANERLKQVDKLKDEFVSLASHELRTPMTIIRSYLWMFMDKKKGTLSEKEQMYLDRAYVSTERLINLVNDMLNVSRIESGRLKIEMKDVAIDEIIGKVVSELVPRGQELGLKLTLVKPATPPRMVHADPERLEQVIINLVGNSFKFTPKGGAISVNLIPEEKDLLVQVVDNGKGMTAENIARLFQKFGTMGGNYLHKPEAQGTGLGLYLSKSLIELQGGKIWAQSGGEGKGSTFSFTLKYAGEGALNQTAAGGGVPVPVPSVPVPSAGGVPVAGSSK